MKAKPPAEAMLLGRVALTIFRFGSVLLAGDTLTPTPHLRSQSKESASEQEKRGGFWRCESVEREPFRTATNVGQRARQAESKIWVDKERRPETSHTRRV